VDYSCQGGFYDTNSSSPTHYSNYGSWVSVVAPGTEIYSTTPWDKPFYLNYYEGVDTRYAYLTGTSMATPYVAATAARRWGYMHGETNDQIGQDVIASGGGDFNRRYHTLAESDG
jgi:subtilisin family serine protease